MYLEPYLVQLQNSSIDTSEDIPATFRSAYLIDSVKHLGNDDKCILTTIVSSLRIN